MGIDVRYEPDIRTMAKLAYGVGKGEKRRYDIKRADTLAFQAAQLRETTAGRKDRFNLASRGLQQQITERAISRGFEREMFGRETDVSRDVAERNLANQLTIGDVAAERTLTRDATLAEQALIRDEERAEDELKELIVKEKLTRGRMTFELTMKQKNRMDALAQGLATLEEDYSKGTVKEDTYKNFKGQLHAAMLGIKPVPKYNDEMTGAQRFEAGRFPVDEFGTQGVYEGNGRLKIIESKSKLSAGEFFKIRQDNRKLFTGEDLKGNIIPADPIAVGKATNADVAAWNEYMGGGTAGVSQEQVRGIAADIRNNTQDYLQQRIREGASQRMIDLMKQAIAEGATDEQLARLDRLLRRGER